MTRDPSTAPMAHYLHLLAARAVGTAVVARPRLPSLFGDDPAGPVDDGRVAAADAGGRPVPPAPVPGAAGVDKPAIAPTHDRAADASARTSRTVVAGASPTAATDPAAPDARRGRSIAAPAADGSVRVDAATPEPPAHGLPMSLAVRRFDAPSGPPGVAPELPPRRSDAAPPSLPEAGPASTGAAAAALPGRTEAPPPAGRRDATPPPAGAQTAVPVVAPVAGTRPTVPLAVTVAPPPAARSMAQAAHAPVASVAAAVRRPALRAAVEPSAATTIQVTIGRLEVRTPAAAPPVARAERRPGPAPTGLEQYLQRRSRGGSAE